MTNMKRLAATGLPPSTSDETYADDVAEHRRAKLASEIQHLAGRSPLQYWILTAGLFAAAIGILFWSAVVNRDATRGDAAALQILLQVLGFLAAILASFAFTRAMSKPGEHFAIHAAATLRTAEQLRTSAADLVSDVKAAEEKCEDETVNALLERLRERILQLVAAANTNVEQWFIVKQASASHPPAHELEEFITQYRIVQQQRVLLYREIYGTDSAPPPSLVITETLYGEDFIEDWIDRLDVSPRKSDSS